METKELYLYKVMLKAWSNPTYVAAENQQQAIDKIKGSFDVDACTLNVEYVDMVTVLAGEQRTNGRRRTSRPSITRVSGESCVSRSCGPIHSARYASRRES